MKNVQAGVLQLFHDKSLRNSPLGWRILFGLAIAALFWTLFLGVVQDLLANDPLVRADLRLLAIVRTFRTPAYNDVLAFITYLGNWQVYAVAAAGFVAVLVVARQWWWIGVLAASLIGEQLWSTLLKLIFARARPDFSEAVMTAVGASFPSGHTLVGSTFYGLVACYAFNQTRSWLWRTVIVIAAAALILAIAYSRVYLGVHWPSDVLGSLTLGPAWVATVLTIFTYAGGRFNTEAARPFPRRVALAGLAAWLLVAAAYFVTHPVLPAPRLAFAPVTLKAEDIGQRLFTIVPRYSESLTGAAVVPINIVLVGSQADVGRALGQNGWVEADVPGIQSGTELLLSQLGLITDRDALMLPDFLDKKPSDLIYERHDAGTSDRVRGVLQFWQVALTDGGVPIWAGTVHGEKLNILGTRQVVKGIEPDIDGARDRLVAGIAATGCLAGRQSINVAEPVAADGVSRGYVTDGKAGELQLHCN